MLGTAGLHAIVTEARIDDKRVLSRHLLQVCGTSGGRWSDLCTWDKPPAEGWHVTIPLGETVVLDVVPPPLASLVVRSPSSVGSPARTRLSKCREPCVRGAC